MKLTRAKLNELTSDLLDRVVSPVKQALSDAGAPDIDHVVLVGGMTRMPAVQEKVKELTGKDPHQGVNPDEVVADRRRDPGGRAGRRRQGRAAARRHPALARDRDQGRRVHEADRAQHHDPDPQVGDLLDRRRQPAVGRGPRAPGRARDGRPTTSRWASSSSPASRRRRAACRRSRSTFDIDADGILSVSAKDLGTGKEQTIEIKGGSGLAEREVDQMIKDAESHAEEDRRQRELAEARNVAENAAYQAEKQLAEMGDKVDSGAKEEIEKAIADVKGVLESSDADEIKAKTDALQAAFHKVSEQIYQQAAEQQAPRSRWRRRPPTAPRRRGGGGRRRRGRG